MLNLEIFGVDFAVIWCRFGSILAHGSDSRNSEKTVHFSQFFAILGGSGGLSGISGAVFGDVGSKSKFLKSFWCDVATCWRQGGEQERQDEPT